MLFLITGSLGAGKTSNTLWDLIHNPEYKDRPKFATHIPDFDYEAHGFEQIDKNDLENWVTWTDPNDDFSTVSNFPKGSIIFIDESDLFFPSSISDKNPPRYMREMARSRHHGLDFYIITQQAKMICSFLLGILQRHIHFHRPNGSDLVTRYTWEHYQPNVYSRANRLSGLSQKVKVDPKVFTLYRSTIENTRIKTPPKHIYKKMALLALPMLIAPFFLYWFLLGRHALDEPVKSAVVPSAVVSPAVPVATSTADPSLVPAAESSIDRPLTYKDFIPDNPLMPYTAPAYAELAKPTDFPRIAACMDSLKTGCKCFTQQYTPVDVPKDSCLRMVKEGWFDNFATGRSQQDQVLSGKPDEVSRRNADRAQKQISQTGA